MSLVCTIFGVLSLYQACIYVYNIFFHPLRHVPGRLLWRMSRIPHEFALMRGNVHHAIRAMHEEYGDVVRVSAGGLSFIHPDAWNDIMVRNYGSENDTHLPVKDMLRFSDSLWVNGAKEILTADDKTHARQRRLIGHAFSDRSLKLSSRSLIQRHVETLVDQMRRRAGQSVDLTKWFSLYNFEVVGDFCLGQPLNCLRDGDYHPWTKLLFESVVTMTVIGGIKQFPWIQALLDFLLSRTMARLIRKHQQFSIDRVRSRLEAKDLRRGDIFDSILEHDGTEKEMSKDEIMANCNLMIAAGSDTTGAALTSCMFSVISNPTVYRTLLKEISAKFQKGEDITIESVGQMPYLEACITEALRVYPPNPNANPRRGPTSGTAVQGIRVDHNVTLGIYHWAANHCSKNFKDPELFQPSRWLHDPRYAYDRKMIARPFSIGSRNCIGQPLALLMIRLAMCRILFHFDVQLSAQSTDWLLNQKAYWVWKKKPLWVVLKERN